jgi:hypothetical protein
LQQNNNFNNKPALSTAGLQSLNSGKLAGIGAASSNLPRGVIKDTIKKDDDDDYENNDYEEDDFDEDEEENFKVSIH